MEINSGLQEGFIFSSIDKHSEDFGINFLNHSYNGFYGSLIDVELDNQENVGYVMVNKWTVPDTLYLLKSDDNFENLVTHRKFNMGSSNMVKFSRGHQEGELFFLNRTFKNLYYSNDYGITWVKNNVFNSAHKFDDIVGGREDGEMYITLRFVNMMWQNAHVYVLHSTDYGITFNVYHPCAKGQAPLVANFSAKVSGEKFYEKSANTTIDSVYYVTGDMPLDVEFFNFSIGDISSYEWDFENDGIIDSNEENPLHTYVDTGFFSVRLTVYDDYDTNSFIKENYIYVDQLTGSDKIQTSDKVSFDSYPNPFKKETTINYYLPNNCKTSFKVFDNSGQLKFVKQLGYKPKGHYHDILQFQDVKPGIYFITLYADGYVLGIKKVVVY